MRISGGRLRGRRLPHAVPKGARPTSARVREALFNIVGQNLAGQTVLDGFGGSGMLALEASSRGAEVVVVERNRAAARLIRAAGEELGASLTVMVGDSTRVAPAGPFDLVLLDPPYAEPLDTVLPPFAHRVRGTLVLEHASRVQPIEVPGLVLHDTRRYGDTALSFYRPSVGSGL
jgi:16S rRNA (guanine966-N2)-methyltransferase